MMKGEERGNESGFFSRLFVVVVSLLIMGGMAGRKRRNRGDGMGVRCSGGTDRSASVSFYMLRVFIA